MMKVRMSRRLVLMVASLCLLMGITMLTPRLSSASTSVPTLTLNINPQHCAAPIDLSACPHYPGDLAWMRPAFASSYWQQAYPGNVTQALYWESAASSGTWWYVDLGAPAAFQQIINVQYVDQRFTAAPHNYYIASNDLKTWQIIFDEVNTNNVQGHGQPRIHTLAQSITARYVGLYAVDWGGGWGDMTTFAVLPASSMVSVTPTATSTALAQPSTTPTFTSTFVPASLTVAPQPTNTATHIPTLTMTPIVLGTPSFQYPQNGSILDPHLHSQIWSVHRETGGTLYHWVITQNGQRVLTQDTSDQRLEFDTSILQVGSIDVSVTAQLGTIQSPTASITVALPSVTTPTLSTPLAPSPTLYNTATSSVTATFSPVPLTCHILRYTIQNPSTDTAYDYTAVFIPMLTSNDPPIGTDGPKTIQPQKTAIFELRGNFPQSYQGFMITVITKGGWLSIAKSFDLC